MTVTKTSAKLQNAVIAAPITKLQFGVLEFIQLLPCFVVFGVLNTTHDGIVTLLSFFLVLLGAPLLYCHFFKKDIRELVLDGLDDRKGQISQGMLACSLILASMVGIYLAFWHMSVENQAWCLSLNIPLERTNSVTVVFFIIFSFVNPVLEEFFWRVFLPKSLKVGEAYNIFVSFHYALYHIFVVHYISQNWLVSLLLMLNIFVLGRFLVYLRDSKGLIVGTLAHLGADMAVAVVYCHLYSHYVVA